MTGKIRAVAGWLLLTVILFVAVRGVEWNAIHASASQANLLWLAVAVAANAGILLLTTAQWTVFLPPGSQVPPGRMFSIVALTASVSNGGPVLAGHATGIHLLATRGGLGHAGGVSLTVLDQVAEGIAKWSLVALAAALVPGFEYRTLGLVVILGVPALALGAVLLATHGHRLPPPPPGAGRWWGATRRFLTAATHYLQAIRRPLPFMVGVALAVLQKAAEGLGIAAVAVALGIHLPLWVVVAALVAVNLSVLVSVTPAHLGLYEGASFLVYQGAGIDAGPALALAVLSHAAYLLPLASTGWLVASGGLWRGTRGRPE